MKRCDVLLHSDDSEPTRLHGAAVHHDCTDQPPCPLNGRFTFSPMAAKAAAALAEKHGEIFVTTIQIGEALEFHVTVKKAMTRVSETIGLTWTAGDPVGQS